jgi:hypothetical protein
MESEDDKNLEMIALESGPAVSDAGSKPVVRPCNCHREMWQKIVIFKRVLTSLPHFVWLFFLVYALSGYVYFGTTFMITTYFTKTLGESAQAAAEIYGVYGIVSIVWIVVLGVAVDYFKRTSLLLLMGAAAAFLGRVLLLLTPQFLPRIFGFIGLLVFSSFGDGAIILALRVLVAERIKASKGRRKITYGILYSGQNLGALFAGVGRDLMTTFYCKSVLVQGFLLPTNFVFLLMSFIALITVPISAGVLITLRQLDQKTTPDFTLVLWPKNQPKTLQREEDVSSDEEEEDEEEEEESDENKEPPSCRENCGVMRTKRFWRFIAFNTLTLGTKSVFRQVDVILPLVVSFYFGNQSAIGTLSNIDPLTIIVLAPLVASATRHMVAVRSMMIGAQIMVLSQWIMAWATPDSMGLTALALFGVVMAVGEAFFGPRLDDYAAEMAGKRHLGFYMMALTPISFAAKFPAAWISGWALSRYCPLPPSEAAAAAAELGSSSAVAAFCNTTAVTVSTGACDVLGLWSLITVITILVSPFLLVLFEPLLSHEADGPRGKKPKEE